MNKKAQTALMQVKVNQDDKRNFLALANGYGLDLSNALRLMIKRTLKGEINPFGSDGPDWLDYKYAKEAQEYLASDSFKEETLYEFDSIEEMKEFAKKLDD